MKKLNILTIVLVFLAGIGCTQTRRQSYSPEQKKEVDSIVFANRNIDSLTVVLRRFENADNKIGEIEAYKELGKCFRESTRFEEAIDCHKKGAEVASQIRDTMEIVQEIGRAHV